MKKELLFASIVFICLMTTTVASGIIGYAYHKELVSRDMRELAYYKSMCLWETGFVLGYGNYQLRSFDGGLNWYAVDTDTEGGAVIIKGLAEEVFPGLMARINGFEKFIKYVEKNGPITLSGDRADNDLSVLKEAGFIVDAKDK